MKVFPIILLLALCCLKSNSQVITYTVRPHTTDAQIVEGGDQNLPHYMASGINTTQTLVLFLHGTYQSPSAYTFAIKEIAALGHHVIGLNYPYLPAVNPICKGTDDITCHWRARMETIDGVDRHVSVNVDQTNSIINRLTKLLQYLIATYPTRGWQQYYTNGEPDWSKIIVSGHSQGASLAGVMGKEYPVKRVVMWSVMDYLNSGRIPDWVDDQTGKEKYYAFSHPKDELVPFKQVQTGWSKLGMTEFGSMVNVQCNEFPYNNTHILYTTFETTVTGTDKYHNSTILDTYLTDEENKVLTRQAIKYLYKE